MTIEEYLSNRIEGMKELFLDDGMPKSAWEYFKGSIDAMKDVQNMLPNLEHDVTLKEFKEYCLRQPYLSGTDKLKTFCGINLDGVEDAIKADMKSRAYGVDPQQYVLDKLAALAEEKPSSPSSMTASPVEGLTVVSAYRVEDGPIVRLLINPKEEWFVVYKGNEQVSQKIKSDERATKLYEKICRFQDFYVKGGKDDNK